MALSGERLGVNWERLPDDTILSDPSITKDYLLLKVGHGESRNGSHHRN